ncbi:hypothetical protein F4803DRAFT_563281 [Xylaria telfairii]|nr:hypothetical protein F4803DRAFT_563281 [Xylaria telfairii]
MDQALSPESDLCMIPAGPPPTGTATNFENPETLVPELVSISTLLMVLVAIFTAGRVFANRRNLWWSDYFVIVASILSLAHTGLMLAQTRYARHQWDVRACWYNGTYLKILFSQEMVASFVLFFSKASIFLLFHQIFEVTRSMRIAIRCGIIFTALLYVIINIPLCAIFNAPRVGETWGSLITSGRPQKIVIWAIIQSVLAIGLDLFILILPIPIIMKLHLSTEKKIRLLAVFTVAVVGVLACVLSLVYRVEAIDTNDGTWKYTALLLCNVVETDVAIIVSCTPGFANFTRTYLPRLWLFKSLRGSDDSCRAGRLKISGTDVLNDSYFLQTKMLAEIGMDMNPASLLPTAESGWA